MQNPAEACYDSLCTGKLRIAYTTISFLVRAVQTYVNFGPTTIHSDTHSLGVKLRQVDSTDGRYISTGATPWLRHCTVETAYGWSDHDGVILRTADPAFLCNMKREKRVYPPPKHATKEIEALSKHMVKECNADSGETWDLFKNHLRRDILTSTKACTARMKESFKTKKRRLLKAYILAKKADAVHRIYHSNKRWHCFR